MPGYRATVGEYYAAMRVLYLRMLRLLASSLGLPEGHFDPEFERPITTLRPLHYS